MRERRGGSVYVLDTNCVSELRKLRPHGAVLAWYSHQPLSSMFLPSIVLYEIQMGANRTRRQDAAKAKEIEAWIDALTHSIAVIPLGAAESRLTAMFMERRSMDLWADAMIAATAYLRNFTVVTRNTRDFEDFPVKLLNPFR